MLMDIVFGILLVWIVVSLIIYRSDPNKSLIGAFLFPLELIAIAIEALMTLFD